jgi:O-antigen/teichoic acid export membrane protein
MFGYLFATLLLPMFSRILTQNTPEILQSLVQMSFKLIWAGSVTLCTAVFFLRNDLTAIMLPHDASAYRSDTLGTLIWVFIPVCSTYIFSTLLTAAGKLNAMNRVFVVGILLDLALNFLLIPDYKAIGAAIATLVTHLFVALWVAKHAIRLYGWQGNNSDLLVLTGFLAYSLVVSLLITSIPCTTACKLTFLSAAALTGVFMFRLLPIKETLRLLQVARD